MRAFPATDTALAGAAAASLGVNYAAMVLPPSVPVRFLDYPMIRFQADGALLYITPADGIALLSGGVLVVRFLAWAVAPLVRGRK